MRNSNFLSFLIAVLVRASNCILEIDLKYSNKSSYKSNDLTIDLKLLNGLWNQKFLNGPEEPLLGAGELSFSGNITLIDSQVLSLPISIGTPPQQFEVLFDIGSLVTWVANQGSDDKYKINRHFNISSSSSFKDTGIVHKIEYGTGSCEGRLAREQIKIFGVQVPMQFLLASKTDFNVTGIDGILGLGRDYLSFSETSLLDSLYNNKLIKKKQFSVKIDFSNTSKLYIGEAHEDFSNDKYAQGFCNLKEDESYYRFLWGCKLAYVMYGNNTNFKENSYKVGLNAIFDTGTNYIFLPYSMLETFRKMLPQEICQSTEIDSGTYMFFCFSLAKVEDISFVFNGYSLTIPREILFFKAYSPRGSSYFFGLRIRFTKKSNLIIMGSPFLSTFHTLFDSESNKVFFTSPEKSRIGNVTKYTHDGEVSFFNFIVVIVLAVVFLLLAGVILYYCCKQLSSKEVPKEANEGFIQFDPLQERGVPTYMNFNGS